MFVYFYRIFDKYDKPLVSLAILGDDNPEWRPKTFGQDVFGCRINFEFPIVKLLDFAKDIETLERSQNPFATVVLAHLITLQTAGNPRDRCDWKLRLVRPLYEKGKSRAEVRQMFRVIDWMMDLPRNLELQFLADVDLIEQEKSMPYVTSIDRLIREEIEAEASKAGLERGLKQGLEKGQLAGKIEIIGQLLGELVLPMNELVSKSIEELQAILSQLQEQLRSRDQ